MDEEEEDAVQTTIKLTEDQDAFRSVLFMDSSDDMFPVYDNYFLRPFEYVDDDDDQIFSNMFQHFDTTIPSDKGQILETSFRRDGASSNHPLRPAVFSGLNHSQRVIICGNSTSSLNVVFTDLARGRATFQDKAKAPMRRGRVVTDMVPMLQNSNSKATILISEGDRLGILSIGWEAKDHTKFVKEYDVSVLDAVPSSKDPVISSGRIREIDVNRKSRRAVIAGHSDYVQVVDLHKWTSITKVKSFGIVGSVRWKSGGSNILTWTTDEGFFVMYDPRTKTSMSSRYPLAPWSSGSSPYTHDHVSGERDAAVLLGYSDGYVDALDLRNGLSKPKLIFRSKIPTLCTVGDIRAHNEVCAVFGESRIKAENETRAESRMGLLHYAVEDGFVSCPNDYYYSSSSSDNDTFDHSSSSSTSRGRLIKKGTRSRISRGSFFDEESRIAVADNMGHLWVVNT